MHSAITLCWCNKSSSALIQQYSDLLRRLNTLQLLPGEEESVVAI